MRKYIALPLICNYFLHIYLQIKLYYRIVFWHHFNSSAVIKLYPSNTLWLQYPSAEETV